jgi:hypothetical protein
VREQWSAIQLRGGVARAEGAFGHSIALGAALAVSMPLVLVAPLRLWVRLAAVVLMLAAVVVTFSRIALVTSCLGLLLSVVAGSELPRRLRALLVVAGAGVGAVAFPLVTQVFSAAGSEATNSAAYRLDLLSLVRYIDVLGSSSAFARAPDGSVSFGAFGSIDSALILQGLWYGWVSLAVALVLLAVAAAAVATRKATAPTIAIAAQIPALATVALITQYASMFWFVVGLAVCTQAARSRSTAAAGLPPTGEFASDQLTAGIACSGRPVGSRVTGERV